MKSVPDGYDFHNEILEQPLNSDRLESPIMYVLLMKIRRTSVLALRV
jgi:hypothetical protein